VENIDQPLLAAALRSALDLPGLIVASMLIASNFGLCAKLNDKTVVKVPDGVYVPTAKRLIIERLLKGSTTMTGVFPTLQSSEIIYPSADRKI